MGSNGCQAIAGGGGESSVEFILLVMRAHPAKARRCSQHIRLEIFDLFYKRFI